MKEYSKVKPLTELMLGTLMDIRNREILNLEQKDVCMIRSLGGLISRGLIKIHIYKNKQGKTMNVPGLTSTGITFLSSLQPHKNEHENNTVLD